jgi:hypothetical protein
MLLNQQNFDEAVFNTIKKLRVTNTKPNKYQI